MTATTPQMDGFPRPEPVRMTLADLLALVVGVAIAAALPWLNRPEFIGPLGGGAGPASYVPLLMFLHEGLGKACLALVPVVLARRVRHGGMVRPTEFLLVCAGLPWLSAGITTGLLIWWLSHQFGTPFDTTNLPAGGTFRLMQQTRLIREGALLTVGILSTLALLLGRRWWPGWLGSTLLMAAWLCAHDLIQGTAWDDNPAWQRAFGFLFYATELVNNRSEYAFVWEVADLLPIAMLYTIPATAVAFGLWHRSGLRFIWHERAALILAPLTFLVWEAAMQIIASTSYPPADYWASTLARIAIILTAALLGLWIVARWLPGWSRQAKLKTSSLENDKSNP